MAAAARPGLAPSVEDRESKSVVRVPEVTVDVKGLSGKKPHVLGLTQDVDLAAAHWAERQGTGGKEEEEALAQ